MISAVSARSFWERLFFVSDLLRNTAYGVLEGDSRINFAQFPIVQFFFECPDARPAMKELIAVIGLSSGAASQAIDSLIEAGFLERVRSETDRRSHLIQTTEKFRAFRMKPLQHFERMLNVFRQTVGATPEEMAAAEEIFVRLAESRTGGELAVLKQPSDLSVPGLAKNDLICRDKLSQLPVWILIIHFTTNLKMPALVYYYGKRGRTTLGKLRLMNYLFFLSDRKDVGPMVKDLASRFLVSSGVVSQTLNAMIQDGMVERVNSPLDHRVIRVRLTPQGLRMRRQTATSYTYFMQNFFKAFDQEKIALFDRILDLTLHFLRTDGRRFLVSDGESDSDVQPTGIL